MVTVRPASHADRAVIAPLTAADYEGYVRLMDVVNKHHHEALPEVFVKAPLPFLTLHGYTQLLRREGRHLIGTYAGGELAGFIEARRVEAKPNPVVRAEVSTHIDEIVVDPGYRRRGLARELLAAAEAWAKAQGSAHVSLTVMEFNDSARDLYEACGYGMRSRELTKRLTPAER